MTNKPPMTTDRMRECLDLLGFSQRSLAACLQWDYSRVAKMARAKWPIDPALADWLEAGVALQERRYWRLGVAAAAADPTTVTGE